jgi:hypothetical protein
VTLTTHPHLVTRWRMSRSYTSSLPKRLHGVSGLLYFYFRRSPLALGFLVPSSVSLFFERTLFVSQAGGFLNLFRHLVELPCLGVSLSQGLYLHRTTQHRRSLERDSRPRSQRLSDQDPRLRQRGHWDQHLVS